MRISPRTNMKRAVIILMFCHLVWSQELFSSDELDGFGSGSDETGLSTKDNLYPSYDDTGASTETTTGTFTMDMTTAIIQAQTTVDAQSTPRRGDADNVGPEPTAEPSLATDRPSEVTGSIGAANGTVTADATPGPIPGIRTTSPMSQTNSPSVIEAEMDATTRPTVSTITGGTRTPTSTIHPTTAVTTETDDSGSGDILSETTTSFQTTLRLSTESIQSTSEKTTWQDTTTEIEIAAALPGDEGPDTVIIVISVLGCCLGFTILLAIIIGVKNSMEHKRELYSIKKQEDLYFVMEEVPEGSERFSARNSGPELTRFTVSHLDNVPEGNRGLDNDSGRGSVHE